MPDTAVVWFRRDLRVRDLPSLAHACREHERVVPLFVFDPALLGGRFRSHGRTAWMLGCLEALDGELRARGGRLVVRHGRPETEVRRVAARGRRARRARLRRRHGLRAARATQRVEAGARARRRAARPPPGPLRRRPARGSGPPPGGPYTVYSPFLRAWKAQERRRDRARAARDRHAARSPRAGCRRCARWASTGAPRDLDERPEPGEDAARRAARALGRRGAGSRATPSAATSWPSRPRACRPTCASAACRR